MSNESQNSYSHNRDLQLLNLKYEPFHSDCPISWSEAHSVWRAGHSRVEFGVKGKRGVQCVCVYKENATTRSRYPDPQTSSSEGAQSEKPGQERTHPAG